MWVEAVGEAAPALRAGFAAAQRGVEAGVDELLHRRGAVGVLVGAGDTRVGGIDVVGGAEHRDLGHQLGLVGDEWARPCGAVAGSHWRAVWRNCSASSATRCDRASK